MCDYSTTRSFVKRTGKVCVGEMWGEVWLQSCVRGGVRGRCGEVVVGRCVIGVGGVLWRGVGREVRERCEGRFDVCVGKVWVGGV